MIISQLWFSRFFLWMLAVVENDWLALASYTGQNPREFIFSKVVT